MLTAAALTLTSCEFRNKKGEVAISRTESVVAFGNLVRYSAQNAVTAPFRDNSPSSRIIRDNSPSFRIRSPSFSPDSKFLVMEYLHADKKAVLAISDIENEQLHKLPEASKGRAWVEPIFSPKGDRIVFVDRDVESPSSRIATIERDGGNFRHFEETANADYPKISHPSLSPNEDTLLFVRSVDLPGEGEIFERDIASGAEIQLTELRFFIVRRLRYLPDGRNFTFSGKTPLVSGQDPRFRGNHIYLMGPDRGYELKPAFVQGNSSSVPSMSADGKKILFRSRTNNLDGIEHAPPNMDLFVRSDGENHRITKLGLSIQSAVLSPDGETVFFVADKARAMNWAPTNKKHVYGFWLMNSDGTNMREIRFPDQPETPVP